MISKRDKSGNKKLTKQQRQSIKSIPARDPKLAWKSIPKKPAKRRKLVSKEIKKGRCRCTALNCVVDVTTPTISHFRNDSQYSREAVIAQLNYRKILRYAKLIYADLPKQNSSQRGFEIMYILFYRMKNIGEIKLVVGRKKEGRRVVYSIDNVEVWSK